MSNNPDQNIGDVSNADVTLFKNNHEDPPSSYINPTPEPTDLIPELKPVDKRQRPYLNIDNPITAESRAFHKRMAFWDLYYKLHGHKVRGYEVDGGSEEDENEEVDNAGQTVLPYTFLSIITLFATLFR